MHFRHLVIKLQAKFRGKLVRKLLARNLFRAKLSSFRSEIALLWQRLHVSLLYRTAFWLSFHQPTYLNLALHHDEVRRLRVLQWQRRRSIPTSPVSSLTAYRSLTTEKQALYQVLKEDTTEAVKNEAFTRMNIAVRSKKRKQRLLSTLWVDPDAAQVDTDADLDMLLADRDHDTEDLGIVDDFSLQDRSARVLCEVLKADYAKLIAGEVPVWFELSSSVNCDSLQSTFAVVCCFQSLLGAMRLKKMHRISRNLHHTILHGFALLTETHRDLSGVRSRLEESQRAALDIRRRFALLEAKYASQRSPVSLRSPLITASPRSPLPAAVVVSSRAVTSTRRGVPPSQSQVSAPWQPLRSHASPPTQTVASLLVAPG